MPKKGLVDSVLAGLSVVAFLVALGMVFFYAPREATMGEVQRIFYFHVASAWVGWLPLKLVRPAKGLSLSTRR